MTNSEILLYQTKDGQTKIDVRLEEETVWLTIDQMSQLFQKSRSTINEHIINIFNEGELDKNPSMRKIGISDFSTKPTNYYNLDVIISVGYRVKGHQGTKFRQWATSRLKEYIVKGFTMNDDLLKQAGGGNYFDELQALSQESMYMKDWIEQLDMFLKMTRKEILDHSGSISHKQALSKAHSEYEKFKEFRKDEISEVEKHFLDQITETEKKLKS